MILPRRLNKPDDWAIMEWWLAVLLGILQGVTEWLPISSSGHLAIFQFYFNEEPPILFDIILHLGSLCVIFYIMREEIREVFLVLPSIFAGDSGQILLFL